ncbi:unannotated protein [freshwater metagenome]|uniref:Unannotated protein n=1 Tax=freshwater metagenome TaxID=449393 RepID=A0A6J6H894_9ZZZZ
MPYLRASAGSLIITSLSSTNIFPESAFTKP